MWQIILNTCIVIQFTFDEPVIRHFRDNTDISTLRVSGLDQLNLTMDTYGWGTFILSSLDVIIASTTAIQHEY